MQAKLGWFERDLSKWRPGQYGLKPASEHRRLLRRLAMRRALMLTGTPKDSLPHSQKASYEDVKAGAGHLHILSQTGWEASLPSEGRGQGWTTLPPDRHGRV